MLHEVGDMGPLIEDMRQREALAQELQPVALGLSPNQIVKLVVTAGYSCRVEIRVTIGEGVGFEKELEVPAPPAGTPSP